MALITLKNTVLPDGWLTGSHSLETSSSVGPIKCIVLYNYLRRMHIILMVIGDAVHRTKESYLH